MAPVSIDVKVSELRKRKLFVATPMYGGQCHGLYMKSCLDLHTLFHQMGIELRFSFLFNESLITRARNYLADEFLRAESGEKENPEDPQSPNKKFTHLMFIDSDIEFQPMDVLALLALDKDIIGAPYPKKSINWGAVLEAIKRNPNISPNELSTIIGEYVFNPIPGTTQFNVHEPLEVLETGTGMMMIKREVFDKFATAYPEKSYKPDHQGQSHFDGSRYIHAYFDTHIDKGKSDRYLSEDYMFCQLYRKIGGQVFICPWMCTKHLGTFPFEGNLQKIAALTGKL